MLLGVGLLVMEVLGLVAGRAVILTGASDPWKTVGMERSDLRVKQKGLLRDQVKLAKRKDTNRHEMIPFPKPLSFEKGFFVMVRACQLLTQHNEGLVFVGVAGPSGAGKTVFTEKVLGFIPSVSVISMDSYNDASRIVDGNFHDPRLTDYDTLLENIHALKEGRSVQVPIYDFKMSCRTGFRTIDAPSSRIVIIEGFYALSEKLRPILDLRVSITGGVHFDLVKRVLRDMQAGQEPEEIIHQISETVYPMYKAFIEPDMQTAHIRIINKYNPFSGFENPMYILKSSRSLMPDQIKAVFGEDQTESKEETSDLYLLPPGEDPEVCQSYLRMQNREGKYNLMFEEWVTDDPFIISPRVTSKVSVRLLSGLMALGYTIAAILKRSTHVFSDGKATVKIDWLEQLNRKYIQVQGRDRLHVEFIADQLGLDGSYIPRTYIELIQLEKLINDVMMNDGTFHMTRELVDISRDPDAEPKGFMLTYFEWITKGFSKERLIGGGTFGDVYLGVLHDGSRVAVKKLRLLHSNFEKQIVNFEKEVNCLKKLRHKNVVRFLGYCAGARKLWMRYHGKTVEVDDEQRLLCFEYVPNGTLEKHIATDELQWKQRYEIIMGICAGVDHIHNEGRILHLDLKPSNILLDNKLVPKIADFGLSWYFEDQSKHTVNTIKGSRGYMAPECFTPGMKVSRKTDVYSLGAIILKLITGSTEDLVVEDVLPRWTEILRKHQTGDSFMIACEQVKLCTEIALRCLNGSPEDRPALSDIVESLDRLAECSQPCVMEYPEVGRHGVADDGDVWRARHLRAEHGGMRGRWPTVAVATTRIAGVLSASLMRRTASAHIGNEADELWSSLLPTGEDHGRGRSLRRCQSQ